MLIEKSLESISHLNTFKYVPWNIELAYQNDIKLFPTRRRNPTPFKASGSNSTKIFKLHGSLNWLYPVKNAEDSKNSTKAPKSDLICLNDSVIMQKPFKFKRKHNRSHTLPLIVPPIYDKGNIIGSALTPVWDDARIKIEEAEELIIFGYSFPPTDYSSRTLFKGSFIANDKLKGIHIIDISPGTINNIAELLNTDFTFHYNSVTNFREKYKS